jgi:5-methylcytosine-specific restriction protein B
MTHGNRSRILPLVPLLAAFRVSREHPRAATGPALTVDFLDTAPTDELSRALQSIADAELPVSFHTELLASRTRFLRHALNHLFRGADPLPERLARCATPGEAYFVAGAGPGLWAALAAAVEPARHPHWCPALERGLLRLGLLREIPSDTRARFDAVCRACEVVREHAPDLTGAEIDDFLERVSRVAGRELPTAPAADGFAWAATPDDITRAVREVRSRLPLRTRIRATTDEQAANVARFQSATKSGAYEEALAAFRAAFPDSRWEGALPALDDAYSTALSEADRARLWCDVAAVLRERFHVHTLETPDVVLAVADQTKPDPEREGFGGFCTDSFVFLGELAKTNAKDWMTENRERYQFVLREPLVELCAAVAERYVRPVLNREYGWDLECDARPGRAVTSICKNDFGRAGPYQPVQWITFYRKAQSNKRSDAQLFVRVAAEGVRYGFHLGRTARDAGKQFRRNIQEHGETIFRALLTGDVFAECRFWTGDDLATEVAVKSAADLRAWATHKTIGVGKHLKPDDPLLRRDELAGDILLTFDRLLPAFACAAEVDPRPLLTRRAGDLAAPAPYDPASFHNETYLSEVWLDRVLGLLRLKKQLVLQGVPGTGKTHVARCLARLLTHDRRDCVRLVQFHPAYSYEEFVEGIRARGVEVNGRSEVTFPVEDGVLCQFAEQATARPSEPHVLIVDELNRGNLPRIFGELLYLLEYRDQAVTLPYSKRPFRLPDNLFLLATMNPLDRSAVALDQALRRRFSFVDMPADAAVLASWLEAHAPTDTPDTTFGPRVVRLFEELNRRLARDLGAEKQVGHSLFMVPELNEEKLSAVWDHHLRPLLLDYLGGREDRLRDYAPERLLGAGSEKQRKPKPVTLPEGDS